MAARPPLPARIGGLKELPYEQDQPNIAVSRPGHPRGCAGGGPVRGHRVAAGSGEAGGAHVCGSGGGDAGGGRRVGRVERVPP